MSVLRNGIEFGTILPLEWDTRSVGNGWYNITVIAKDAITSTTVQDTVLVRVLNSWNYNLYSNWTLEYITRTISFFEELHHIDFSIDFTGNFEVFFQGNIYSQSGQRWVFLNLRIDGNTGNYYYFRIENEDVDYYIYIKDVFRNIEPGNHRASIYWAEGNSQPATFVCYRLAKIGVAPII